MLNIHAKYYSYSLTQHIASSKEFEDCLKAIAENAVKDIVIDALSELMPCKLSKEIIEYSQKIIYKYKYIVIIGMGASLLNPQMIGSFSTNSYNIPNILYIEYPESKHIDAILSKVNPKDTLVLAISKSGKTIETNIILQYVYEKFEPLGASFLIMTKADMESPIVAFAQQHGCDIFDYSEKLSGRYNCMSEPYALIGLVSGVDLEGMYEGARSVLTHDVSNNKAVVFSAATLMYLMRSSINQLVSIHYNSDLIKFGNWYVQLIAESLGKKGFGLMPISSCGSIEHHTRLQLYLDGGRDKFFSLYRIVENEGNEPIRAMPYAEFSAMKKVLVDHTIPYRAIELDSSNGSRAQALGAITAHAMLEVVLCAISMELDPFTQPAVECMQGVISSFMFRN